MPLAYFTGLEQIILNFVWNHKRPQLTQTILRKKKKAGGIVCSVFKLYYKVIAINIIWYWHKTDT